jgi:hypothetical protein
MSELARSAVAEDLDAYEVSQSPVMTGARLAWQPWVTAAVQPYEVTRLPHVTVVGLWDALRRAERRRDDGVQAAAVTEPDRAAVIELAARRVGQRASALAAVN